MRSAGGPWPLMAAVAVSLLALSGCGRLDGDFGRPKPNLLTGALLPLGGALSANMRGEPLSRFPWTDDERELRDRAFALVTPAHERDWFDRAVAELRFRDAAPAVADQPIPAYHSALVSLPAASVASRYNRLQQDAQADRQRLGPFLAAARRVREADRVRRRAMDALPDIGPEDRFDALGRIAENARLTGWTCASVERRIGGYRYALDHLVVEGPQREAILAERALILLETDPKAFCSDRADLREPNPYNPHLGLGRPDSFGKLVQRPIPIADEAPGRGGAVFLDNGLGVGPVETRPLATKD